SVQICPRAMSQPDGALRSSATIWPVKSALIRLFGRRWIKRMSNNYTYVDPDYIYTDPQTSVLRNIGNIADNKALQFAEAGATARRSQELWANTIPVISSETLFSI